MARKSRYCPPQPPEPPAPKEGVAIGPIDRNGLAMVFDERGRPIRTIFFGAAHDDQ